MRIALHILFIGFLAVGLAFLPGTARAASDEEFYSGRALTIFQSAGAGGTYAAYVIAFAPYFEKHIPGNPTIVVDYMPGAGGIRATNFINSNAPKDGSVLGLVHSSVPFAPLYGISAARFDPMELNWIGAMNSQTGICVAWHESDVKVWDDLFTKEFFVGSTGAGSQMEILPHMINELFGTNITVIPGYTGGNDVFIAMERGEVDGRCGGMISGINSTRPTWFPDKLVSVPIQIGLERNPLFPDVPALGEFAKDQHTRDVLELALSPMNMFGLIVAPPGVPETRVATLRAAYHAAMNDPGFISDAARIRIEISEVDSDHVYEQISRAYAMPPDVVASAREAMNLTGSR
ncbi:MAG: tripartite tricarboxylate transporter substrate-binding protein [Micropepsaceae bacterium]